MPILPGSNSCGADTAADDIYNKLVDEEDFEFPDIDLSGDEFKIPPATDNPLYDDVDRVSVEELTTRTINGAGVFDALMQATHVHLEKEFNASRISGREYSEVYTASIQSAMGQAVAFLMGKDQAYWQAILVQAQARRAEIEAVTARIQLENTKLEYITLKAGAKIAAADYGMKKLSLALMDVDYCIKLMEKAAITADVESKVYSNTNILPLQRDQLEENVNQIRAIISGIGWDNQLKQADVEQMLPKRIEMLNSEMESAAIDRDMKQFQMDEVLPWQSLLTREQSEAARAQTLGNRSDGTPVAGVIGLDNLIKHFTLDHMLPAQHEMVQEQVEGARAQTLDTRTDGTTPVAGLIGKQKDLYTQQITSYQRDAEVKAAKMFIDSWVTQKTIDEALLAPTSLQNASVDTVMNRVKVNNGLNT